MREESAIAEREEIQTLLKQQEEDLDRHKAERRRLLYQDVESLILTGFLTHSFTLANVHFCIRSLSPGDQFLIRSRINYQDTRSWKLWVLATSVWMVNGQNLLPYPHAVNTIYSCLESLPPNALDLLFSLTMGLFNRVGMALKRTEAYCYEPFSRLNWKMCGRTPIPSRDENTGIPGSGRLGSNHVQRMWVAFNLSEDERTTHILAWQSTKLLVSALSPKGAKKLNASDDNLQKQEDYRRREAIHKMLLEVLTGSTEDEGGEITVMVRGQPVTVPRVKSPHSAEDLEKEMQHWLSGEQDWHDIVVETYKNRIRDQFKEEQEQRERQPEELPATTSPMVGYTTEQMETLRPELFSPKAGVKRVFDGSGALPLYERYIAESPRNPKEHAPRTLTEEMQTRRPTLSNAPIPIVKRQG